MPQVDQYLTVGDAALLLGVSPNTVRNWGRDGKLDEYRHPVNNYRLFKAADLRALRATIQRPRRKPR